MSLSHQASYAEAPRPRVWVVDDSPVECEAIRQTLAVSCDVGTFPDGPALVEALGQGAAPEVLVLDWYLPVMSGLEVCRFVRAHPATALVPVLLLTANTRVEDVEEALAAGADDYVFKPFRAAELTARVRALAARERKRRQQFEDERARRVLAEGTLTEVQAAEERAWRSELRFRLAARATRDAVWEWDPRTGAVDWTSGLHELFDHTPGRTRDDRNWWEAQLHPDDRERVVAGLDQVLASTQHEWQDTYRFRRGDGTWAFVVDRCHIVRDAEDRPVQVVGAMQDVTAQQEAEAERLRLLAEVHAQADFERQLIGIVSHDLRNPLGAITLAVSMLLQKAEDERQLRHAQRIQRAAERATRMIRDLLDFTRARQGRGLPVYPQRMDLHEVVHAALDELQAAWPERRIEARYEGSGAGEWDPDRVAQVLGNLVGNAMQYSPPDTRVRVEARGEEHGVVLTVHNDGLPIPLELKPRIFEPLERGMERPEDRGGRSIGLGLYIVRSIVVAHGGTVEVQSTTEAGTTFTVRLPRRPPTSGSPPTTPGA
ncbi:response regulator [Myxococcus sp. K15C18031901]|uniref:ATP-binding protein n=1 Tax=Myxococcus dinghuensis TaxID=2906761 RepID=UPI0020A71AC9|nr:ATP-binding protein [Myxococcus dinghuensis]MCP3099069.1 response regulator [Myxococcus dinghuensis]